MLDKYPLPSDANAISELYKIYEFKLYFSGNSTANQILKTSVYVCETILHLPLLIP